MMDTEKTMTIYCEICDTRRIQEKAYQGYDKIILNAEVVIVNGQSKAVLEKLNINCNAEEFIEVDNDNGSDIPLVSINGVYSIGSAVPAEEHIILMINGSLMINPGAEEALKHYKAILVNGSVLCPDSMSAHLSRMSINGSTAIYPDGYILLPNNFVIDKYFPLRAANNGKYFVPNAVKLLDKTVNTAQLAEKNIQFKTKKLLVPEEKIEEVAPLFEESTEFIVIPCGFTAVDGNAKLDGELIKKYGNKIFVYGNLDAKGDISDITSQIDSLKITGRVALTKKSAVEFNKINAEYKKADIVKEVILRNKAVVRLNNDSISLSAEGISLINCGVVTIESDVIPQSIIRLVDMKNIGTVVCSQEQVTAVEMIGINIGRITTDPVKETVSPVGSNVVTTEKYIM
jgi:hypothetical protein